MRKSFESRLKLISEKLTFESKAAGIDPETGEAPDMLKILRRAAKEGDPHAKGRLETYEKLRAVLATTFAAAEKIAEKIPGEFKDPTGKFLTEKWRAWEREVHRLDTRNWQLFGLFYTEELIAPDGEDLEKWVRQPFVADYIHRIHPAIHAPAAEKRL
jgi:hypothetical protein